MLARRREREMVTVFWSDEGLSLATWKASPTRTWFCTGTVFVNGSVKGPAAYAAALREVEGRSRPAARRAIWLVLAHQERTDRAVGPSILSQLPVGLMDCWRGLSKGVRPWKVLSASSLLGHDLLAGSQLTKNGYGVCFFLSGRPVLVVRTEDEARPFFRIGRTFDMRQAGLGNLLSEWLLQSRAMFQSRTGGQLQAIHLEAKGLEWLGALEPLPFELVPLKVPVAPRLPSCRLLSGPEMWVHLLACESRRDSGADLRIPEMEAGQAELRWGRCLKAATLLMLTVGCLFAALACQQAHVLWPADTDVSTVPAAEWTYLQGKLEKVHAAHAAQEVEARRMAAPFRLVGRVVGSSPPEVEISSVRMSLSPLDSGGEEQLHWAGFLDAKGPTRAFKQWLEGLPAMEPGVDVHDVSLRRAGDGLSFKVEARLGKGGQH